MSFLSERTVKATRKPHHCGACETIIETGSPAARWVGLSEGQFTVITYHPDCRDAEIALNTLHGTWGSDEWIGLWDLEHDDIPWLLETFPTVAARKHLTPEPTP